MSIEIDPNVARQIARDHIRSGRGDIGMSVIHHFGMDLADEEFFAWESAVHESLENERRTVSWPDKQEGDVRAVVALMDAAGAMPMDDFNASPLAAVINALYAQFEDRIDEADEAELLARVQAFKVKIDAQATAADRAVAIHVASLDRRYGHNDGSLD